jgi:hypothetical protein
MKLIAPRIDDIPTKCTENITRSTEVPGLPIQPDKGAYRVQPAPQPFSINTDIIRNTIEKGSNQKLKLLNLGKTISGLPIWIGTMIFPNPPIINGITIKNIIRIPCAVIQTL